MAVVSNLSPSEHAEADRAVILKIFSSIGRCRFLDEKHFDACTALSGSGPAFACIFLEAMADGGVMMGLPRAEALELAAQSEFLFFFCYLLPFSNLLCFRSTRRSSHGPPRRCPPGANQRFCNQWVFVFLAHRIALSLLPIAPGGCTIAGLLALEDGKVRSTIARGIQIATERASELGQPAKK